MQWLRLIATLGIALAAIGCADKVEGPLRGADDVVVVLPQPADNAHQIRLTVGTPPSPGNPAGPVPVMVEIRTLWGERVRLLFDGTMPQGTNVVVWDARDDVGAYVAAGNYELRVTIAGTVYTRKITVIR